MRWKCPTCGGAIVPDSRFCQGCGSPVVQPPRQGGDPYIGRVLGNRFEIQSFVAEGGMGKVYRGIDRFGGRSVAVKVLRPEFLMRERDDLRRRFIQEGQSLFNVSHPNIVQFLAFWEDAHGEPFLIMEYLTGNTVGEMVGQDGPLDPSAEILPICCQALDGLHHLHSLPRPLVHRDVKPDNIWVQPDGVAKLMDLGIAKDIGGPPMTQLGKALGTIEYMSPEQVQGTRLGPASDQYSLGIAMYHMACGEVPFRQTSETGIEVMNAHVHEPAPDPRERIPSLPDFLADAIMRALSKRPEERFDTCFLMKRFLQTCGQEGA